jgi:hypothetical protein
MNNKEQEEGRGHDCRNGMMMMVSWRDQHKTKRAENEA